MSQTQKKEQAAQTTPEPVTASEAEPVYKECWSCLLPMNEALTLKDGRTLYRCPKCGRVDLVGLKKK